VPSKNQHAHHELQAAISSIGSGEKCMRSVALAKNIQASAGKNCHAIPRSFINLRKGYLINSQMTSSKASALPITRYMIGDEYEAMSVKSKHSYNIKTQVKPKPSQISLWLELQILI
jgi:hypothetical protein